MITLTLEQARAKGSRYYFTGKPCKNGHIDKRLVSTRSCCACSSVLQKSADKKAYKSSWYFANKDELSVRMKVHYQSYYPENKHQYTARAAQRRARLLNATPPWASNEDIKKTYALARWVSELYQRPFEVDHIIPLQGDNVCGLHVENNLQILPMPENRSKSNKLIEEHP